MCDKALDLNWITFKFIPDWFATNKMLEKFDKFISSNGDKFFHDEGPNTITFLNNDMTFNTNLDQCVSGDKKKEIEPFLNDKKWDQEKFSNF